MPRHDANNAGVTGASDGFRLLAPQDVTLPRPGRRWGLTS
jgi:hypothetical protein